MDEVCTVADLREFAMIFLGNNVPLEHILQLGKINAMLQDVLAALGFVPDEHADQRSWPRRGINSY